MRKHGGLAITDLTGLVTAAALNLFAIFVLHKPSAIFFSEGWWSSWFPVLVVWFVFLLSGCRTVFATKSQE